MERYYESVLFVGKENFSETREPKTLWSLLNFYYILFIKYRTSKRDRWPELNKVRSRDERKKGKVKKVGNKDKSTEGLQTEVRIRENQEIKIDGEPFKNPCGLKW